MISLFRKLLSYFEHQSKQKMSTQQLSTQNQTSITCYYSNEIDNLVFECADEEADVSL